MENSRLNTFYALTTIQSRLNRLMPNEFWAYDDGMNQVFLTDATEGDDVIIEIVNASKIKWTVTGHSDTFDNIDDLIEFNRNAIKAEIAAALPPEEPPGERVKSHGLRVGPKQLLLVDPPIANSSIFVLPNIIPSSFSILCTTVAEKGAI